MARGKQQAETEQTREEREAAEAYERFLEDAIREPVKFIKHDARAHDDEELYRVVSHHDMTWYGWYWLLAELLANRKDHSYDVSDDLGWRRLALDMSCMCDMSVPQCKEFIEALAEAGLVHRAQLEEMHQVVITRIRTDALAYAETVAAKKLGAWKTNRKRLLG